MGKQRQLVDARDTLGERRLASSTFLLRSVETFDERFDGNVDVHSLRRTFPRTFSRFLDRFFQSLRETLPCALSTCVY